MLRKKKTILWEINSSDFHHFFKNLLSTVPKIILFFRHIFVLIFIFHIFTTRLRLVLISTPKTFVSSENSSCTRDSTIDNEMKLENSKYNIFKDDKVLNSSSFFLIIHVSSLSTTWFHIVTFTSTNVSQEITPNPYPEMTSKNFKSK